MKTKKTIESRVADAVLQRDIEVSAGGKTYNVPAPTLGTLVLVSEAIANMPEFDGGGDMYAVLRNAKNGRCIAEVLAIYILGVKRLKAGEKVTTHRKFLGFPRKPKRTEKDELTDEILTVHTPGDINTMLSKIMQATDFQDFFDVSTFLREARMTKPTKVESKTTASGQS